MSATITIAFACNLAAVLLLAAFGITYLTRREFMPYHAVALGKSWAEVGPPVRVLVLALMKALGGLCLTVALLQLALLLLPFRQGVAWSLWVVPAAGLSVSAASLYGMSLVARDTPASPPWILPVIGGALSTAGLGLSLL